MEYVQCKLDMSRCRDIAQATQEFCSAGCMPFLDTAMRIKQLKMCLTKKANTWYTEAMAGKRSAVRESFSRWLKGLTSQGIPDMVETMARHAYKTIELGRDYGDTKSYIANNILSYITSNDFVELVTELDKRSSAFPNFKTFGELVERLESIEAFDAASAKCLAIRGVVAMTISMEECFDPSAWEAAYCSPALWPYVGFYAGLRHRLDNAVTISSHGRKGTHYYAHPSCARAAITELLGYMQATWVQPGISTSFNKRVRDTVHPTTDVGFSCQAFTNGFKQVMTSAASKYLPPQCRKVVATKDPSADLEHVLSQLEQHLSLLEIK
eukprot:c3890_g1_i1.p1 GENE.c3890_g1_i1~~c3890_g1_i1.p1  ORF type:complete len:325 (-),score=75.57 c3890_g1_i1:47-1021(-)